MKDSVVDHELIMYDELMMIVRSGIMLTVCLCQLLYMKRGTQATSKGYVKKERRPISGYEWNPTI